MSTTPNQDISSFPLSPSLIGKLDELGFQKASDFCSTTPLELSKELSIDIKEAVNILNVIKGTTVDSSASITESFHKEFGKSQSVFELLSDEQNQLKIVTFCAALDDALSGGIPLQKITEICGTPGIGKTQFGIQLAVDVQIPTAFGGVNGEAIYIDTEGSLTAQRVYDVAKAASQHILQVARAEENQDLISLVSEFTTDSVLERIYLFRCLDYVEVIAVCNLLMEFIESHPKVKLIVLDSIAFHFRQEFEDMVQRTSMLQGLVQQFHMLASEKKLAVVIMNQMTTKFSKDSESKEGQMIPALGDNWGHACNNRIILSMKDGKRHASLVKSSSCKDAIVSFNITCDGIRDLTPVDFREQQEQDIPIPSRSKTGS